jgi:hypothetical protein
MGKNETLIILISAAFRIAEPIRILLDDLVVRMTKKSLLTGGKYFSAHLRFEEVSILPYVFTIMTFFPILLVAFSCYTYDGGLEGEH